MLDALSARGIAADRMVARDLRVAPCTGCFGCWTRTPGQCVIDDDARAVAAKVVGSDLYVVVTPVSFGSVGSLAKSVSDRLICLVLPHFKMIDGEVHHQPRYDRYPRYVALGTLPAPDPAQEALFRTLAERNAINLHNPASAAGVVAGEQDAAAIIERLLTDVAVAGVAV